MTPKMVLLCATSLALGALVASAPTAAAAPVSPQAQASSAAAAYVAGRPLQIHGGAGDAYVAGTPVAGTGGLQYTPYTRTYRGLPVLGGDFVVVSDANGAVLSTSVGAQRAELTLATDAPVSSSAAAATALGRLPGGTVQRTTKVVDATGDSAAIAWESVVTGRRGAAPSRLHVVVDGTSGAVLRTWDEVQAGTGDSAYNGPNPVAIDTRRAGSTFAMTDPQRPGISCRAESSGAVLTGPDDLWGDGDAATLETGCVDALFAVQHEWSMLADWLGRDGIDGQGNGFPVFVGLDDVNAYWDGSSVHIGHNEADEWISSQDVVGHEFGHAVDAFTPGGNAGNGVSEATGDIFGTALEFFVDQAAAFDAPDWTIGEEIDLVGTGPIRDMADPAANDDPACWSKTIPRAETHAAAGPMNHWFYLVAGGRATPGGSTVSRCNGATVTGGLGVQAAFTLFYNAMLAKTTGMDYLRYRTATLTVAKNLTPGDCAAFRTVQAAWNAVDVPVQAGEPTCVQSDGVTVTHPGDRNGIAGSPIRPITMSAEGGSGRYTWSATGLPAGVTIDRRTGTISGTPTAAGISTVTVTARAGAAHGSTSFSLSVRPAVVPCTSGAQLLANPGFETTGGWQATPSVIRGATTALPAHSGSQLAVFGGVGLVNTDVAKQTVTVPTGCATAQVSFWYRVVTAETTTTFAYDTLTVKYGDTTLGTVSNLSAAPTYARLSFPVPADSGRATIRFVGQEDGEIATTFLVDDVAFTVSP